MKTIFLSVAITLITACAFSLHAAAQNDLGINEEDMPDLSKPLIIHDIPSGVVITDSLQGINERAVKNFKKEFPHADNLSWYKISNGFIASFDENAIKTKVYFSAKGKLNYSVKYYEEQMLPYSVKNVVKSIYYDYSILSIAEIHVNEANAQATYVISIQDKNNLKILTVYDGEILSTKSFKTA